MKPLNQIAVFVIFTSFVSISAFLFENIEYRLPPKLLVPATNKLVTIKVATVEDLYKEVNKPSNEGVLIVLDKGSYVLDASKSPATKGRIEFQKDMQIMGYVDFATATGDRPSIIDGSKLPPTSFQGTEPDGPARTGCIRMGKGHNSLSFITLIGNPSDRALSGIDTDLEDPQPVVEIHHTVITNSQQGIDIRNAPRRGSYRLLTAFIHNNIIRDNNAGLGKQGISIQNSNGADSAEIKVVMSNNDIHNNNYGLRIMNLNVEGGTITVISDNDKFSSHSSAIVIWGGRYDGETTNLPIVKNNTVKFFGNNTQISSDNTLKLNRQPTHGPIFLAGGYARDVINMVNNNTVLFNLNSPHFQNNDTDIYAFGVRHEKNILDDPKRENLFTVGAGNSVMIQICDGKGVKVKRENSDYFLMGTETNTVTEVKCPMKKI